MAGQGDMLEQCARSGMDNAGLQGVDFLDADGRCIPGLVRVRGRREGEQKLSVDEHAVVLDADLLEEIDFVYFRRFSDGRSSQIAAYVVDNSDGRLSEQTLPHLHREVWLQGRAPLLYVSWGSRVDVLSCARGPDFWDDERNDYQYKPAKKFGEDLLTIAGEISSEMQRFSALRLADGTFWDDPHNKVLARHEKAAHQAFIQAVVDTDKSLDGKENPVLRRLLLIMVLVKHLEDRKVFPEEGRWFGRFRAGARCFFDVLKGGEPDEVQRLLSFLERRFNGDVFNLSALSGRQISKASLKRFAQLVEARTIVRQRYLWEQYSFRHLPVEIISHLYQRFVEDGHGAVYTPPFLAGLLLDQAMPYDKLTGSERVLDPACGSGVFLVGAFRRLVNVWRSKNGWRRPAVEKLKEILGERIFGIDLESDAVDLTAFSLALAVCDALKPEVIWDELKFDPLRGRNLFEKDFFELVLENRNGGSTILEKHFDVVVGNPPFESNLTKAGVKIDHFEQLKTESRGKCPDNQAAYLFFEQALGVLRAKRGQLCMIQPAGFLYNEQVNAFRTYLFGNAHVDIVLDLASIRNLYTADVKTVAVCCHAGRTGKGHFIQHWTFRRTASVKERICFELDHYDHHHVSQKDAEFDPFIWRTNLLGGGRLVEMSRRLRKGGKLGEYLERMKEKRNWDYGEGFIVGNRKNPAPFLTGHRLLPSRAFGTGGIEKAKLSKVTETHFEGPRCKDRYSAPLVLIKELDSLPMEYLDKGFLAYGSRIVGIHAPASDSAQLRKLYDFIRRNHETYRFCCLLSGTEAITGNATSIRKQDIDSLPYPECEGDLEFSFWEEAICEDVIEYMTEYIRLGQNSHVLRVAAGKRELRKYANMFVKMLGSVYDNLRAGEPKFLNGLTCQPFYFGDQPEVSWLDEDSEDELLKLIYYENSETLRTVRVFRVYSENVILVVKPDRLRYWIRSTAIRDADETLVDLQHQGY